MRFCELLSFLLAGKVACRWKWRENVYVGYCSSWNGNVKAPGEDFKLGGFFYISDESGVISPWSPTVEDLVFKDWDLRNFETAGVLENVELSILGHLTDKFAIKDRYQFKEVTEEDLETMRAEDQAMRDFLEKAADLIPKIKEAREVLADLSRDARRKLLVQRGELS